MDIIRKISKNVVLRYAENWFEFKRRIHALIDADMLPDFSGVYLINIDNTDVTFRVSCLKDHCLAVSFVTDGYYGAVVRVNPVPGRLGININVDWPKKEAELLRIFACVHLCSLAETMTPERKPSSGKRRMPSDREKPASRPMKKGALVAAPNPCIVDNAKLPAHVVFEVSESVSETVPVSPKRKRKEPDHAIQDRPFIRHYKNGTVAVIKDRVRYKNKGNPQPGRYKLNGVLPVVTD